MQLQEKQSWLKNLFEGERSAVLLVFSIVFLLPFGRLSELPILITAILAGRDLLHNRQQLRSSKAFRLFSMLFLCIWLPMLISTVDAVNTERALRSTLGFGRFYLAGVFMISRLRTVSAHRQLSWLVLLTLALWCGSALFELFFGFDLFSGQKASELHINGIFGGENIRLGFALMTFLPLALAGLVARQKSLLAFAVLAVAAAFIFVAGIRMAWLALAWFALLLALMSGTLITRDRLRKGILACAGAGAAVMLVLALVSPSQKMQQTLDYFDGGLSLNQALSGRVMLFEVATDMARSYWVNGVGVRSYRYVYPEFAGEGDSFLHYSELASQMVGDTHPHQLILEVASETGIIGLLGLSLFFLLLVRIMVRGWRQKAMMTMVYAAGVLALLMPVNSHLAIYSSYWAAQYWVLIGLLVSMVMAENQANTRLIPRLSPAVIAS